MYFSGGKFAPPHRTRHRQHRLVGSGGRCELDTQNVNWQWDVSYASIVLWVETIRLPLGMQCGPLGEDNLYNNEYHFNLALYVDEFGN